MQKLDEAQKKERLSNQLHVAEQFMDETIGMCERLAFTREILHTCICNGMTIALTTGYRRCCHYAPRPDHPSFEIP